MDSQVDKSIERKLNRILSRYNIDELDAESRKVVDGLVEYFKNSLQSERREYKIITNQMEVVNQEIKETMAALRENNIKMSQQSRLEGIGEMAANLSHEVNNPLTTISLLSEESQLLLSMGLSETNVSQVKANCDKIIDTVGRISKIMKGVKRISNHKEDVPVEDHLINKIYEETASMSLESFKNHKINYQYLDPAENYLVKVQEVLFSQVVLNLLNNAQFAVKDLPDLSDRWIKVHYEQEGNFVCLYIENGGPSIPKDIHERIFEPFFTTKKVGEGTGIGLRLCRQTLRSLGGDVTLLTEKSHPVFKVMVPMSDKK